MKRRSVLTGIIIILAMTTQAYAHLSGPAGGEGPFLSSLDSSYNPAGSQTGFSFKLDGKKYNFTNGAVGGWDADSGFTVAGACDASYDRLVLVAFQGNKPGTYKVSMKALYNQIQFHDVTKEVSWVAVGNIGSGTIKVTAVGPVGKLIKGTFNGSLDDMQNPGRKHPISGSFVVERYSMTDGQASSLAIAYLEYWKELLEEAVLSLDPSMQEWNPGF